MSEEDAADRFRGCLLGLAVGDAVGTTVEFAPRGSFAPVTDMTGGGPFDLEPGEWTDDTSMALCLAVSLTETGGFDARDQMDRYVRWNEEGYLSSNGRCFDIGNTVAEALRRYRATGDPISGPTDPQCAGNGSIMRLAPVPMFYFDAGLATVRRRSAESSRPTHGAAECVSACRLLGEVLRRALRGDAKDDVLFAPFAEEPAEARIAAIAEGAYREKGEDDIRGSGYVVRSLEAALWCLHRTDNFKSAILRAANLGEDADTTAAVCGQVAGAHYGIDAIPASWLRRLALRERITALAERLRAESPER